jgi:hypothetical protein
MSDSFAMSPRNKRKLRWPLFGLVLLFLTLSPHLCEAIPFDENDRPEVRLRMIPTPRAPRPGDIVDVAVMISKARNVVATPFKVQFDSELLRYRPSLSAVGPFLKSNGARVSFLHGLQADGRTVAVGIAELGDGGPAGGVSGRGRLCTLSFEVLPDVARTVPTQLTPFSYSVWAPGLVRLPSVFRKRTIAIRTEPR